MAADRDGRVRYLDRLLDVVQCADALADEGECWVTGEHEIVCGKCLHCELVWAVDKLREEPKQ